MTIATAMPLVLALIGMADDFDRLEGKSLAGIPKSVDAQPRDFLTVEQLGTLPNVLAGTRTAVVIVKTDEANLARLLISPGFRNTPGKKGETIPILVIDRFETFEAGPATKKLAKGRDLILFDGFRLDLDTGQIVPEGQGGDLQFVATGDAGPRLNKSASASMFTLKKSPLSTAEATSGPSPGRNVVPGDFAGKYRLFANGQTTGEMDWKVDEEGAILGRMRSDQTGGSYKVTGKVGPDPTNRVRFSIELPRARQEFDGFLFLEGKGAIAGTFTLLERPFGFFAIRDGGVIAPNGEDVGLVPTESPTLMIVIGPEGRAVVDGKAVDEAALIEVTKTALAANPKTIVVIKPVAETSYQRISLILGWVREAGATAIRFESAK